MDSLTQIVLGAAVGEAVLGRKIGNKAIFYGAIAGTIPDLDVLSSHFVDITRALELHRGFSHSIVFSLVFAPMLAWLVTRYEKHKDFKDWTLFFFWGLFTHPILDAFTTWGTQLFWPFNERIAFQSIFVIDPLYTIPFMLFLILAMFKKRTDPKRRKLNRLGLILSSGYLIITLLLKGLSYMQFTDALERNGIVYSQIDTRPTPMNTILWSANIDAGDHYLLADYSFFDSQPISFAAYPKNHQLLNHILDKERIQRMIRISQGWYVVTQENGQLYFSDLRFGLLGMNENSTDFVFKYLITEEPNGEITFTEVEKSQRDAPKLLKQLWERVKGI